MMLTSAPMPLHGALLISNPRREKTEMALALTNGARRRINKVAREAFNLMKQRPGARKNPFVRSSRISEEERMDAPRVVAAVLAEVKKHGGSVSAAFPRRQPPMTWEERKEKGLVKEASKRDKALRSLLKMEAARQMGIPQRRVSQGSARRFEFVDKYETYVIDAPGSPLHGKTARRSTAVRRKKGESKAAYTARHKASRYGELGAQRVRILHSSDGFNRDGRAWYPEYPGLKVSGKILAGLEGKKKGTKKGTRGPSAWNRLQKKGAALGIDIRGMTKVELNSAIANAEGMGAVANPFGALALENPYGALALENPYGALALENYGALALENPVPFVGAAAVSAAKLVGTGLVGAMAHAALAPKAEELIARIPVVGEKVLTFTVPEAIPVVGGMGLTNTIMGTLLGTAVVAGSQIAGRKFNLPMLTTYGSILGTGIIVAGPVMDYAGRDDEGLADMDDLDDLSELDDLSAEDLGALALENEGVFGDGMAYQTAELNGSDYGCASLGDAYYSGADFDLGEGEALINGQGYWRKRYGTPPRRLQRQAGSASHLAGRPGHRWGWLIKMVGWANTRKIAAMQPQQRLAVLKKVREAALVAFQQQVGSQEVVSVSGEGAASGSYAADGAHSSYGSTIFAGEGL
jgi:hypothetical protein